MGRTKRRAPRTGGTGNTEVKVPKIRGAQVSQERTKEKEESPSKPASGEGNANAGESAHHLREDEAVQEAVHSNQKAGPKEKPHKLARTTSNASTSSRLSA